MTIRNRQITEGECIAGWHRPQAHPAEVCILRCGMHNHYCAEHADKVLRMYRWSVEVLRPLDMCPFKAKAVTR